MSCGFFSHIHYCPVVLHGCVWSSASLWASPELQGTSTPPLDHLWPSFCTVLGCRAVSVTGHTQHHLWLMSGSSRSLLEHLELALFWHGAVLGSACWRDSCSPPYCLQNFATSVHCTLSPLLPTAETACHNFVCRPSTGFVLANLKLKGTFHL